MGNPRKTPEQRFWPKVDKSGECWLWTGCQVHGYGSFFADGKYRYAHRWAYEHFIGPVPPGREVGFIHF